MLIRGGVSGKQPRCRSHSISEFPWCCLFAFIFVGQRCIQLRVRSAKWADSPRASSQVNGSFQPRVQNSKWADSARAPSQVNGRSSPHYDSPSFSQSRRIFIQRRLLVWRLYHWVDDHQNQKLNIHFKVAGPETSLNPGGQQGIWFPASLTGKVR